MRGGIRGVSEVQRDSGGEGKPLRFCGSQSLSI